MRLRGAGCSKASSNSSCAFTLGIEGGRVNGENIFEAPCVLYHRWMLRLCRTTSPDGDVEKSLGQATTEGLHPPPLCDYG